MLIKTTLVRWVTNVVVRGYFCGIHLRDIQLSPGIKRWLAFTRGTWFMNIRIYETQFRLRLKIAHLESREPRDHTALHRLHSKWILGKEYIEADPVLDSKRSLVIYTRGNKGNIYSRTAVRVVYEALAVDAERTVGPIKCNHRGDVHNRKTWLGADRIEVSYLDVWGPFAHMV